VNVWFIWSIWSVWFISFNQKNQTDQIDRSPVPLVSRVPLVSQSLTQQTYPSRVAHAKPGVELTFCPSKCPVIWTIWE